jgi:hypothetical protein
MVEMNFVTLEDGLEYAIIDEIEMNFQKYVYLANIKSDDGFLIRKVKDENGENYLTGLDNDQEFDKALKAFQDKLLYS